MSPSALFDLSGRCALVTGGGGGIGLGIAEALAGAGATVAIMGRSESADEAAARGVIGVPSVVVGDQVFWGDDRLEEAAAAVR